MILKIERQLKINFELLSENGFQRNSVSLIFYRNVTKRTAEEAKY